MDLKQPAALLATSLGGVFFTLLGLLCAPVVIYVAGPVVHEVLGRGGRSRSVLPRFGFAAWRRALVQQWHRSKWGALRHMWGSAGGYLPRVVVVAVAGWICGQMISGAFLLNQEIWGQSVTGLPVVLPVAGALLAVRSLVRSVRYGRGTDNRMRADPVYAMVSRWDMKLRFTTLRQLYLHRSLRSAAKLAAPLAGFAVLAALPNGDDHPPADGGTALVSQADLNGYALLVSLLLAFGLSTLAGKGVDRLLIHCRLADHLRQCLRPPYKPQKRDLSTFYWGRRRAFINAARTLTVIGRRNDRDSYDDDLATLMYNTATYIRKFLSTPDVRDVALPTQMVDFLDKVMVVCANPWARPASEALRSAMADNPVDLMQHPNMPERRLSLMKRLKASTPSFIMLSADAWKIILILIAIISILLGRRGLSDLPIPN